MVGGAGRVIVAAGVALAVINPFRARASSNAADVSRTTST
jgi:hypothetical protein